jgi:hypothetical protein
VQEQDGAPGLPLWFVTLTLAGERTGLDRVVDALEQLLVARPFMLSVRYAADRAELRYWDEAEDVDDAAALGLRLWGDYRDECGLPPWRVVGLEVLDQATVHARGSEGAGQPLLLAGLAPL